MNELKRQAAQIGVSVTVLSARMILERLVEITQETDEEKQEENSSRGMFTCHQRVSLTGGEFVQELFYRKMQLSNSVN